MWKGKSLHEPMQHISHRHTCQCDGFTICERFPTARSFFWRGKRAAELRWLRAGAVQVLRPCAVAQLRAQEEGQVSGNVLMACNGRAPRCLKVAVAVLTPGQQRCEGVRFSRRKGHQQGICDQLPLSQHTPSQGGTSHHCFIAINYKSNEDCRRFCAVLFLLAGLFV